MSLHTTLSWFCNTKPGPSSSGMFCGIGPNTKIIYHLPRCLLCSQLLEVLSKLLEPRSRKQLKPWTQTTAGNSRKHINRVVTSESDHICKVPEPWSFEFSCQRVKWIKVMTVILLGRYCIDRRSWELTWMNSNYIGVITSVSKSLAMLSWSTSYWSAFELFFLDIYLSASGMEKPRPQQVSPGQNTINFFLWSFFS